MITPPFSGDVIVMLLFLAKFVRAEMCLLGKVYLDARWLVVDAVKLCMKSSVKFRVGLSIVCFYNIEPFVFLCNQFTLNWMASVL